ncbi:MAG: alanine racemase [Mycobacteriales bacterium]
METDQRIDWRCKGLPPAADGLTVPELAAAGYRLPDLAFPVAVVREDAVAANVAAMAAWCAGHGALLAPHGKTAMAPWLSARQLAAGAWAITVATVSQARVYRAAGVRRLLLANQLVDPVGIDWVRSELDRDPDFSFGCFVDSAAGVGILAEALAGAAPERPLDAYVEIGVSGGRAGCRTLAEALEVAALVAGTPGLRLAGVAGWEGGLGHDREPETERVVREFLRHVRTASAALQEEHGTADWVATAGGSAYFDWVVEELAGPWRLVLRGGCYALHDVGLYQRVTPLPELRAAVRVWGHVLSRPEPDLALAGVGRRDVGFDQGLPVVERVWRRGAAEPEGAFGLEVTALNDQHAFLRGDGGLAVGDLVGFGISHPCTTVDRWRLLPVVDAGHRVVDGVWTYF